MSKSKRATEGELSELHGVVARVLKDELTKPRDGADVPAAILAQAINFLKANNIDAAPTSPSIQNLVHSLPFSTDEGEDAHFHNKAN